MTSVTKQWTLGQNVSVGMLKNLTVKEVKQQGDLTQFILIDNSTGKEYSFVPGGLRKTFEPPVSAATSSEALDKAATIARRVLKTRCKRQADAETKKDLEQLLSLLASPAAIAAMTAAEPITPSLNPL